MDKQIDPRLVEFDSFHVAHDLLTQATDAVRRAIVQPNRNTLISVIGPSGVGKSLLMEKLISDIEKEMAPQLIEDRECIPVVFIEARTPFARRGFDFRHVIRSLLLGFNEIGVDRKLPLDELIKANTFRSHSWSSTANGQREALENVLIRRRPRAIFIDEAHAMTVSTAKADEHHFGLLKGLVNVTQTPFVLLGTYRLLDYGEQAPEILRRRRLVHFPRYLPDNKSQREHFADIVNAFSKALPIRPSIDLTQELELLFLGSLGCVGLLKQLLAEALDNAITAKDNHMRLSHVRAALKPNHELAAMLRDIKRGELVFRDTSQRITSRDLFGTAVLPIREEKAVRPPKGRRRPGQRNPSRDNVNPHRDEQQD